MDYTRCIMCGEILDSGLHKCNSAIDDMFSTVQDSARSIKIAYVISEDNYWRLHGLVSSCIKMYKESFMDEHLLKEDELYTQLLEIGAFVSVLGKVKSCFPE